jgi:hypothetical protein
MYGKKHRQELKAFLSTPEGQAVYDAALIEFAEEFVKNFDPVVEAVKTINKLC